MEDKEKKVFEAALAGDWVSLNTLVREDPLLLDRISLSPYETPLHVAALRGHDDFARCLLSHCPRLASESDTLGRSPLHVAAAAGHIGVVREIIRCAPPEEGGANSICLVKSKAGMIPLHAAVMKGRVEIVRELVSACPESTRVRLARGETVLHLCVRYDWLEVMKVIVEMDGGDGNSSLLEQTDDDGNTVFHLAALHKQLETIKYLYSRSNIDPNIQNKNGFTALDLLVHSSSKDQKSFEIIAHLLERNNHNDDNHHTTNPATVPSWSNKILDHHLNQTRRLEDLRGPLIIVASILAASTFKLGVKPPEDESDMTTLWNWNSLSFVISLTALVLLISGLPLKRSPVYSWILILLFCVSMVLMAIAYLYAVFYKPDHITRDDQAFPEIMAWFVVVALVGLVHTIGLIRVKVFN